ncbi:MAG: LysM peptidoglycan-binding domain-containing protein, partial [Acidobacteria bacterium]|nr:LysM peptidoglycan-binding domain-containing protein [Acidobacteriota bacterium]
MSIRIADVEQHKVQTGETLATIANGNGLTTDQLTKFNWNTTDPKEINRCLREIVGCTKRTNDGKNYILDSSDNPGLLYIPKPLQLPGLALNKDHVLRVRRPRLFGRITIQTVDYYGHPRPDFSLRLEPLGKGRPLTVKTDSRGVWTTAEIDSGRYEVLESDGQPAYYYEELNRRDGAQPESPFGELKPAVFTTRVDTHTIITVVVGQEPPYEARQEVQRKADAYTRNETRDESAGRGSETAGLTRRSAQTCADNLLLAAGLTRAGDAINWAALAGDILPGYFDTYYPSVSAQGFYVAIFDADERLLRLFNSSGVEETRLELNPDKELACLYGSYAVFQNESGPYFVDLATRSFMIKILNNDTDLGVESLVRDPSLYTEYTNRNTGKVEIVVVAPELKYMDDIAMQGGTGALENYGDNAEINEKIHQRNLGVCREIRLVYEAYIRGYVDRVNEAASESELRELGPPFNIYEMPSPAGWTKSQLVDIFNALNTNAELDAWVAIAHKLDAFGNRLSQGLPFFRLKVKWKKDLTAGINDELTRNTLPALPKFVKVDGEVEFNLDLQSTSAGFRKIVKHDEVLKVSGKFEDVADEDVGKWNPRNAIRKVTKNGFVLEANFQQSLQNPEKRAVALRVDDYSFQIDSTGKTKLSTQSAPGVWIDTEFNNRT